MKNKILLTSALTGLVLSASAANAQLTVSGNVNLSYKAAGNSTTANKKESFDGFGKESQINFGIKGKLNNGWDYAAGTSIEHDGTQMGDTYANQQGMFNENTYIDFINGNTTITFGTDHIQNSDFSMANIAGFADFTELADGIGGSQSVALDNHNSPYNAFGVGLMQKTPAGTFSFLYAPSGTNNAAMTDITDTGTKSQVGAANSAYEIGFRGDLGLKGLDAAVFYNATDTETPGESTKAGKKKGKLAAAKYTFGNNVTIAAEKGVNTATTGIDTSTKAYGIAYALSQNMTVGYTYAKTDVDAQSQDEKLQVISLGYNLGPVLANVQYVKAENVANTAASDGEALYLSVSTKF
jgi:hypothetical protein